MAHQLPSSIADSDTGERKLNFCFMARLTVHRTRSMAHQPSSAADTGEREVKFLLQGQSNTPQETRIRNMAHQPSSAADTGEREKKPDWPPKYCFLATPPTGLRNTAFWPLPPSPPPFFTT